MLFYIVPLMCVFFKLSSAGSSCSQARDDDFADPFLPTVELKIIEFPNENILPIGYNITIACISNTSNTRGELVDLPFWIQFYYNSPVKVLHYCGGSDVHKRGLWKLLLLGCNPTSLCIQENRAALQRTKRANFHRRFAK